MADGKNKTYSKITCGVFKMEKHISEILDERNQNELMQLVIDTFEKQLSKRPVLDSKGRYICTECISMVIESFNFCPNCGQKIKWEA